MKKLMILLMLSIAIFSTAQAAVSVPVYFLMDENAQFDSPIKFISAYTLAGIPYTISSTASLGVGLLVMADGEITLDLELEETHEYLEALQLAIEEGSLTEQQNAVYQIGLENGQIDVNGYLVD